MDVKHLEEKLDKLREKLHHLETVEVEKMRIMRINADMGDDWKENEGAKLVEQQHDVLYLRTVDTKKQIVEVKKQIWKLKYGKKEK